MDKLSSLSGVPALTRFEQLKMMGDLPSPKGAALAIIRLTQDEATSLPELAHAVKIDPAFAGRVIKTANGLRAAGRRPIASIQDALSILGIPAVRSLALGFSLLSGYRSGNCKNFDFQRYWSHSLVCAVALQAITVRTRAAPADDSFSIGLLSRVGELALATLFPVDYSRLLDELKGTPATDYAAGLLQKEQAAFVITHNELTAFMLADWGMPKLYSEAVVRSLKAANEIFDTPTRSDIFSQSIALAQRIADACLAEDSARGAIMPGVFDLGKRVAIDAESLASLCDRVAKDWREWASLLKVNAKTVPPFEQIAQSATPEAATEISSPAVGESEPTSRPAVEALGPLRILVADADNNMRSVLADLLHRWGHEVFLASSGQQAFDMALDLQPQVLLVDWSLPEMNGVELTKTLRQTKLGRGIYILILTGLEDESKLVEAFESGVDDFLGKPLKARVLGARLRAGQRVIRLQQELEHDREEIRRFAAELAVANRRLQDLSVTDALTGFPNRRYAMERFEQEWSAAERGNRPLCCLVVDIDSFKMVNDTYGHDVGDAVLKQIVEALKTGMRTTDTVARMGGDEFLVICPDTPLDAAVACAERVRHAVEQKPVAADGLHFKGSISVGVAVRDEAMKNYEALIKAADKGLYVAKKRGRNCVVAIQQQA